jgi:uncharacterized membrane protein YtjA (UPF0391 family)
MQQAIPSPQRNLVLRSQPRTIRQEKERPDDEHRSNYDSIPGDELPPAVYRTIVFAFAWMMLAAWLAFGGASGTDLDLAVATVLFVVFLALPIIMYRTARNRLQRQRTVPKEFISSRVDIATGTLSAREAWLQVLMIPIALALAATLIGGAYVFLR